MFNHSKVNTIDTVVSNNDKCFRHRPPRSRLSRKLQYSKPTNVYLNEYEKAKMHTRSSIPSPVKCTHIQTRLQRHLLCVGGRLYAAVRVILIRPLEPLPYIPKPRPLI